MLSRLPRAERRAMALDSRKSSFRPSARSRVALIVNAKADVASTNGSLSSQKIRNPYSLPRSERARADEWRTVYDFPQWIEHRNTARLFLNFASSVKSQVLLNILPSVAWCTGVATLLCTYMYMLKTGILPSSFPNPQPNIACQTFINATSVALSLLLVFRTNNGYGRWDEARKLWGLLVNRTRDLIRQGVQTFPEEDFKGKKALGRWIIAATQALRIHLQPDPGVTLESTLGSTLSPNELAILKKSAHRPMSAISAIGRIIQDQPISPYMQALMYQNLTAFHDILGGCERILRAPIPLSYTRHTGRFLFGWLTCLPFALFDSCGPWSIPVCFFLSIVLCGIEEIGVQAEEPFGILPLEIISKRIATDVIATIEDDKVIRNMIRDGYRDEHGTHFPQLQSNVVDFSAILSAT